MRENYYKKENTIERSKQNQHHLEPTENSEFNKLNKNNHSRIAPTVISEKILQITKNLRNNFEFIIKLASN